MQRLGIYRQISDRAGSRNGAARAQRQDCFETNNVSRREYIDDRPPPLGKPEGLIGEPGPQLVHVPRQLAGLDQGLSGSKISGLTLAKDRGQDFSSPPHSILI